MKEITVAIMMGSKSDAPIMEEAAKVLQDFGVSCEMRVLSAHRTPKETVEYMTKSVKNHAGTAPQSDDITIMAVKILDLKG